MFTKTVTVFITKLLRNDKGDPTHPKFFIIILYFFLYKAKQCLPG